MILARVTRAQRVGVYQLASVTIPSTVPYDNLRVTADISNADYADTANQIRVNLYRFDSADGVWKFMAGTLWTGGNRTDPELGVNPRPYIALPADAIAGKQLRGELEITQQMNIGCVVEGL